MEGNDESKVNVKTLIENGHTPKEQNSKDMTLAGRACLWPCKVCGYLKNHDRAPKCEICHAQAPRTKFGIKINGKHFLCFVKRGNKKHKENDTLTFMSLTPLESTGGNKITLSLDSSSNDLEERIANTIEAFKQGYDVLVEGESYEKYIEKQEQQKKYDIMIERANEKALKELNSKGIGNITGSFNGMRINTNSLNDMSGIRLVNSGMNSPSSPRSLNNNHSMRSLPSVNSVRSLDSKIFDDLPGRGQTDLILGEMKSRGSQRSLLINNGNEKEQDDGINEKTKKPKHLQGTTICDKIFAASKEEVYDTVLGKYLPINHPSIQRTLASTDPRHDASSLRGLNEDFTFVKKLKKEKENMAAKVEEIAMERQKLQEMKLMEATKHHKILAKDENSSGSLQELNNASLKLILAEGETEEDVRVERLMNMKTKDPKERENLRQSCGLCERLYHPRNVREVIPFRCLAQWREKHGEPFPKSDPRLKYNRLYDPVFLCVFCTQFFDPDFYLYHNYHRGKTTVNDPILMLEGNREGTSLDHKITEKLREAIYLPPSKKSRDQLLIRPESRLKQEMSLHSLKSRKAQPLLMSTLGCELARYSHLKMSDSKKPRNCRLDYVTGKMTLKPVKRTSKTLYNLKAIRRDYQENIHRHKSLAEPDFPRILRKKNMILNRAGVTPGGKSCLFLKDKMPPAIHTYKSPIGNKHSNLILNNIGADAHHQIIKEHCLTDAQVEELNENKRRLREERRKKQREALCLHVEDDEDEAQYMNEEIKDNYEDVATTSNIQLSLGLILDTRKKKTATKYEVSALRANLMQEKDKNSNLKITSNGRKNTLNKYKKVKIENSPLGQPTATELHFKDSKNAFA